MTITINTLEYTKVKHVEIDGVNFTVRPMNSAETMAITAMQRSSVDTNADAVKMLEGILEIYFGLFDNPEKAKEVLKDLPVDALISIYQKIMAEGE